jgi:hypothetical protein
MTAIFAGTAQVEIQGQRVLHFLKIANNAAEFEIVGLSKPKITLTDRRPSVVRVMAEIEKTRDVSKLARFFNQPAFVLISPPSSGVIKVDLNVTRAKKPRHMLWVAIGIEEENIPYYPYVNVQIEPTSDKKFALFSLYKRPRPQYETEIKFIQPLPWMLVL